MKNKKIKPEPERDESTFVRQLNLKNKALEKILKGMKNKVDDDENENEQKKDN